MRCERSEDGCDDDSSDKNWYRCMEEWRGHHGDHYNDERDQEKVEVRDQRCEEEMKVEEGLESPNWKEWRVGQD